MLFPVIHARTVNKVSSGSQTPILTLRSAAAFHRDWKTGNRSLVVTIEPSCYRRSSGSVDSLEWNSTHRQYTQNLCKLSVSFDQCSLLFDPLQQLAETLGRKMSMSTSSASLMPCFNLSIASCFFCLNQVLTLTLLIS